MILPTSKTGEFLVVFSAIGVENCFIATPVQADAALDRLLTGETPFRLSKQANPTLFMHLRKSGIVDYCDSPPNRESLLHCTSTRDGRLTICSGSSKSSAKQEHVAMQLGFREDGSVYAHPVSVELVESSAFVIRSGEKCDAAPTAATNPTPATLIPKAAILANWKLRHFALDGFVLIGGVIPQGMVAECRRLLRHELGQVGKLVLGSIQGGSVGKFGGEMSNHPTLRQVILKTSLQQIVQEMLGGPIFNSHNLSCQVAFRFPELDVSTRVPGSTIDWHTDSSRQGSTHAFSLLVGICLSDVVQDNAGNLAVWPGSHFLMHRCKKQPGGEIDHRYAQQLVDDDPNFADFRVRSDAPAEPEAGKYLGGAVQLHLRAGDVVILHSDIAHGGAPNESDCIREMLYFRVKAMHGPSSGTFSSWTDVASAQAIDIWAGLDGLRSQLGEELTVLTQFRYRR